MGELLKKLKYACNTEYKLISVTVSFELHNSNKDIISQKSRKIKVKKPLDYIYVDKTEVMEKFFIDKNKELKKFAKEFYEKALQKQMIKNNRSAYQSDIIKGYCWTVETMRDVEGEELTFEEWKNYGEGGDNGKIL